MEGREEERGRGGEASSELILDIIREWSCKVLLCCVHSILRFNPLPPSPTHIQLGFKQNKTRQDRTTYSFGVIRLLNGDISGEGVGGGQNPW